MPATNADTTHPSITDQIMKDKCCNFEFCKVSVEEVKKYILSINNDNLDGKLLKIISDDFATPICHIFNLSPLEYVHSGLGGSKSNDSTLEE
jgi:hypothetical protein